MEINSEFFTFIFYISFNIYIAFGVYILLLNSKATLNRLFFAVSMSFAIWVFAFMVASFSLDYESALLYRRLAAIGWGSVHSFGLHFFLVLTEREFWLKKKWIHYFLYIPALGTIAVFGLIGPIARGRYDLIYTANGWSNASVPGFADGLYNLYYISFALLSCLTLLTWEKAKTDPAAKNTVLMVSFSFIFAVVFGSITDIFFVKYLLNKDIPQLGSVVAIIIVIAIFFAVKKHGLMGKNKNEQIIREGDILTKQTRKEFYHYITLSFVFGSLLNFGHFFYFDVEIESVLLFSTILFLLGIVFSLIPEMSLDFSKQDAILAFLIAFSIPLIQFRFLEIYASNIVWPIPIIFIVISVVFRQKYILAIIATSAFLTGIWSWVRVPELSLQIGNVDHIGRISIYTLGVFFAFYLNNIYVSRLVENEKQISLQKLISEISIDFVSVTPRNLDDKIQTMLKKTGEFFNVDRSYLFLFSENQKTVSCTHEWCVDGIDSAIDLLAEVSVKDFPWWTEHMKKRAPLHIEDVNKLPTEALAEQELLELQKIQSLLSISVSNREKTLGFLGFDSVKEKREWNQNQIEAIEILANLLSDAMVKVEAEKKINYVAFYDSLTGLPNRRLFNDYLNKSISFAQRKEKLIGVVFIDLDSFKNVNDTMGHEGGDLLLKEVAKRLSENLRNSDIACRFGGDEFLVMFPQMEEITEIKKASEKIMSFFKEPLILNEQEIFMTASAGVSIYPFDGEDVETLIKNADLAMYHSKEQGKNQIALCTSIMKEEVKDRMQLTNQLYRALERNEFFINYQPQVNIATKKIVGMEALIRWEHPEKGLIPPASFIHLAEQTRLINPIGRWAMETACRQNKIWQEMGLPKVTMAVNLSVEQFRDPKLVEMIGDVLRETNLEPRYLELEITESIAIKEPDYIITVLKEIKKLGVSVSIDDFGTEYSSLSRIKELPIDRLKMAMQFVHGLSNGPKDQAIATVIINLAKSLGLRVIAEGVETKSQLTFLEERVCDEVQGFYFYKPLPAEEIEKLLAGENDLEQLIKGFAYNV